MGWRWSRGIFLGFRGLAQPSPTLSDALNARYLYSKCGASDATRTSLLRSMWSTGRRRHGSTRLSGTCAARIARRCGAIHTNEAIWSPCGNGRFPRVNRRLLGSREKGVTCRRRKVLSTSADIIGYLHMARKTNSFFEYSIAAVTF
jgi:hypothetical protein